MTQITNCLKKWEFKWSISIVRAFEEIKKLNIALVLRLPDFSKVFVIACDASGIGICDVLRQESHLVAFFGEKLNTAKQCYDNYDHEFYAVVQSLICWCHYLLPKEFILYSNQQALLTSIHKIGLGNDTSSRLSFFRNTPLFSNTALGSRTKLLMLWLGEFALCSPWV